jgi:hypothetical protein
MQAFFVHRHRNELRAGSPKRAVRSEVSGLLDRDAIVRLEQRRRGESECRLRAWYDEDLIGLTPHGPRSPEMLGDGDAKAPQPGWVAVRQLVRGFSAHVTSDQFRPRRAWEEIERRETGLKRHRRKAPVGWRRLIGDRAFARARAGTWRRR